MLRLAEEFDNKEHNHFSNYDYVLQIALNGQFIEFKRFVKLIDSQDLLKLLRNNDSELSSSCYDILNNEILSRIN